MVSPPKHLLVLGAPALWPSETARCHVMTSQEALRRMYTLNVVVVNSWSSPFNVFGPWLITGNLNFTKQNCTQWGTFHWSRTHAHPLMRQPTYRRTPRRNEGVCPRKVVYPKCVQSSSWEFGLNNTVRTLDSRLSSLTVSCGRKTVLRLLVSSVVTCP